MSMSSFGRLGLALSLASTLGAAAAAQEEGPTPLSIFGVRPQPLGAASLSVGTDPTGKTVLKVSNLGSSGLDGVSIAPDPDVGTVQIGLDEILPTVNNDASVVTEIFGTVNGGPVQRIVTYTSESSSDPITGTTWHTRADFSSLGTNTVTVTGHDFGMPAFNYAELSNDLGVESNTSKGMVYFTADNGTAMCTVGPDQEIIVTPAIPIGGGPGPGTGVVDKVSLFDFTPGSGFTGTVDSITRIDMRFTDTQDVSLTGFEQKMLGAFVSGVHEAQVSTSGGVLLVDNLGSSGCDGVSISPGPGALGAHSLGANIAIDLTSGGPPTPGAFLEIRVDANVGGTKAADFTGIDVVCPGGGLPDEFFPNCGWNTFGWILEGLSNDAVAVVADPTTPNPAVDNFFALLETVSYGTDGPSASDPGAKALTMTFSAPTELHIQGAAHVIDTLRLTVPSSDAWQITNVRDITIQTQRLSEFAISSIDQPETPYTNLGTAKSNGHVTVLKGPLSGGGALDSAGSLGGLLLRDAPASAPSILFVGLTANPLPFKGGELVPLPALIQLDLPTDANGSLDLPFLWPAGIPSQFELIFQYAVQDLESPEGVWLSNAMRLTTP